MTFLPSTWITCDVCDGKRFNDLVLGSTIKINNEELSIADIYSKQISEIENILIKSNILPSSKHKQAKLLIMPPKKRLWGSDRIQADRPPNRAGPWQRLRLNPPQRQPRSSRGQPMDCETIPGKLHRCQPKPHQ